MIISSVLVSLNGVFKRTPDSDSCFPTEILSITGITIRDVGEPGKGARFEMTVHKGNFRTVNNKPVQER